MSQTTQLPTKVADERAITYLLSCRHELQVDDWEDVPFSNETALAAAVSQTPVIVAICCGPAIDDWHHYTGAWRNPKLPHAVLNRIACWIVYSDDEIM
jgi:hypothetical protein